jgi:arsenite-transporting ATPase
MFKSKAKPAADARTSYDPRHGKKIIFFGGKGGVGKTTCSSAFAISCAKSGDKTLLVSTDPAHSLADVFGVTIGPEIIEIADNLYALEIDAELESKRYTDRIKSELPHGISPVIVEEITRQIDAAVLSPGSEEAAIFDKFIEIIEIRINEYDRIVFDTAPTGHTLRLLSLPELLGGWMDSMIKKRRQALNLMKMVSAKTRSGISRSTRIKRLRCSTPAN